MKNETSAWASIPGSARLRTHANGAAAELAALERAAPAALGAAVVAGETVGRAVVRSGYVPVLLDVFDRLALVQEAEEQTAYFHLYRLALADERNFCRVSRRDLARRTSLSELRLQKALAGLAGKGHIVLLDRDRVGTLYKVKLPHEVFGDGGADDVLQKAPAKAPAKAPTTAAAKAPAPPAATSPAAVASAFAKKYPGRGREPELVLELIMELREEGHALADIAGWLDGFGAEAPRTTPVWDVRRRVRAAEYTSKK